MTVAAVTIFGKPGDPPVPFVPCRGRWASSVAVTRGGSLRDASAMVWLESGEPVTVMRVTDSSFAYRPDRQGD